MSLYSLLSTPLALQASPGGAASTLIGFVPIIAIFAIFYVLVVLPMRKRQKALQQTIDQLKKGDRILTTGGLYGEIVSVDSTTIVLKIADNPIVRVRIARSAVAGLEGDAVETGGKQP
ncbi:MAG: preprotein translocase subunit YajC [Acidobacteriota bacterium]|nr:preprotein translocase subunit YajC [Acidobacteriota bacterium]